VVHAGACNTPRNAGKMEARIGERSSLGKEKKGDGERAARASRGKSPSSRGEVSRKGLRNSQPR